MKQYGIVSIDKPPLQKKELAFKATITKNEIIMEESEENISQSINSLKKQKPPKSKKVEENENPLVQIYHRVDQKELEKLQLGHKSELKGDSLL